MTANIVIDLGTFVSRIGTAEVSPAYIPQYAVQTCPAEFQQSEIKPPTPFANAPQSLFAGVEVLDFEQLERIFTIAAAQDLRADFSAKPDFTSTTI